MHLLDVFLVSCKIRKRNAFALTMSVIADLFNEFRLRLEALEHRLEGVVFSPVLMEEAWFRAAMQELKALVRDTRFEPIAEEIISSPYFLGKAQRLRSIYELYEVFLETATCLDHLQVSTGVGQGIFANAPIEILKTSESAIAEAKAAGIKATSRVAFVGSGPFPETALSLAHEFGCSVTCVDYNPEAVVLSSRLLKSWGMSERLPVFFRDAMDFSFEGFTHVWLAALARPKRQILERVCETSTQDLTVVCRTVNGLREFLYESANDFVLEHFDIVDKVIDLTRTSHYALVLRKRPPHSHVSQK